MIAKILSCFSLDPIDGVMILLGATFFLITWKTLANVLFLPYLELYEKREQASGGALRQADDLVEQAGTITGEYEMELNEVRVAALREKDKAIQAAKAEATEKINQASAKSRGLLSGERTKISTEIEEISSQSIARADELAAQLTEKILSDAVRQGGV